MKKKSEFHGSGAFHMHEYREQKVPKYNSPQAINRKAGKSKGKSARLDPGVSEKRKRYEGSM